MGFEIQRAMLFMLFLFGLAMATYNYPGWQYRDLESCIKYNPTDYLRKCRKQNITCTEFKPSEDSTSEIYEYMQYMKKFKAGHFDQDPNVVKKEYFPD